MTAIRTILFVMFDQLRHDYLGCAGHPHLRTPHIDALAARGVRFSRAYVQSPICGPARMCFYTGRYVHSHGASWNGVPLRAGEPTLGDHLRAAGMGCWLVGKTHMREDAEGMARLGLGRDSAAGARVAECGFDVWERDDGLRPEGPDGFYDDRGALAYNAWLRGRGYASANPWHDFANAGRDGAGAMLSGWFMANAGVPAAIAAEDSETPYITRRATAFLDQAGEAPVCAHVSYIKPHWPYIAPPPWHALYGPGHVVAPLRDARERADPHPLYASFMDGRVARAFQDDRLRERVIPAYMGLVGQCDEAVGRLVAHLRASGRADSTLIVVTSDHGDYLGDHWLGEKDLFHDPSVRIPLIVVDPRPEADATRGTVCDALVESIDLAATFVEAAGGAALPHVLEGRSLLPFLHGRLPAAWRDCVFSEYDLALGPHAARLGLDPMRARLHMVFDGRWKYVRVEGMRPMLHDLADDPCEYVDRGADPGCAGVVAGMEARLLDWALRPAQRITLSAGRAAALRGASLRRGVTLGLDDGSELPAELTALYRGRPRPGPGGSDGAA
ncbi:MAG: sulfatase-like hydrolase/transferase [Rhodobacteraceae bacterium]|nr:sulfatase-like hydrolase/transferase [Paracoccaceae bacterium]